MQGSLVNCNNRIDVYSNALEYMYHVITNVNQSRDDSIVNNKR